MPLSGRRQNGYLIDLDLPQPFEYLPGYVRLLLQLVLVVHHLPLAAAADPEMPAGRLYPVVRRLYYLMDLPPAVGLVRLDYFYLEFVARNAVGHEDRLALMMPHRIAAVGQILQRDIQDLPGPQHEFTGTISAIITNASSL